MISCVLAVKVFEKNCEKQPMQVNLYSRKPCIMGICTMQITLCKFTSQSKGSANIMHYKEIEMMPDEGCTLLRKRTSQ